LAEENSIIARMPSLFHAAPLDLMSPAEIYLMGYVANVFTSRAEQLCEVRNPLNEE